MDLGFHGEIADLYHRFRRGYPPPVIDALANAFALTADEDVVIDLGCGTGQLTLPIAERVRSVVAVDPEPDMLLRARRAADDDGIANVTWTIGSDTDIPTLGQLIGKRLAAVTVGQALHWMRHDDLFRAVAPLVRPGGGIAVVTNGSPLWQQNTAWSRTLRSYLEDWLGSKASSTCGTDDDSQRRYRDSLTAAGYDTEVVNVDYAENLTVDQIVGGVYSALPAARIPATEQRPVFAEQLAELLDPHAPFIEQVRVTILTGRYQSRR